MVHSCFFPIIISFFFDHMLLFIFLPFMVDNLFELEIKKGPWVVQITIFCFAPASLCHQLIPYQITYCTNFQVGKIWTRHEIWSGEKRKECFDEYHAQATDIFLTFTLSSSSEIQSSDRVYIALIFPFGFCKCDAKQNDGSDMKYISYCRAGAQVSWRIIKIVWWFCGYAFCFRYISWMSKNYNETANSGLVAVIFNR